MKNNTGDNTKLGVFVLAGLVFLIFSLYMIGRNRNLFGSSFRVSANFRNVNGLMIGNNVRFSGIDVGTVEKIEIMSDTLVRVTMILEKGVRKFVKKNAVTSVGTDGLMGNKLININSMSEPSPPVQEGDVLASLRPIEGDEMLRTLNTTNENMAAISNDLKKITQRINNSNGLWKLLSDTMVMHDIKEAGKNLKHAGYKVAETADQASDLLKNVQQGKGLAGAVLSDSMLAKKLKTAVSNIEEVSNRSVQMSGNLNDILKQVKYGKGPAGVLVADTALERKLRVSIFNVEQGTQRFNENMEALKHNFLFRGYFRKQEKLGKSKQKK
ncbi:MAG: MCE family protein [Bacteroidetes bacterium]|nr:MCE family protein [Bacteroidota bacterium]